MNNCFILVALFRRKLEKTYSCILGNSQNCDTATNTQLLKEVKSLHSILGNISCSQPAWCETSNATDWLPWQQEVCSRSSRCSMFNWLDCVTEYGLFSSCLYVEFCISWRKFYQIGQFKNFSFILLS